MNERIKELADQAHHITTDELAHLERVHNRKYGLDESVAIYNKKFAELIVKECSLMANRHIQHNNPNDCLLALEFKEHFGVE